MSTMSQDAHLNPLPPSHTTIRLGFDCQGQLLTDLTPEQLTQVSWVSVPSQQVLLLAAVVPGKGKSQWQQALPFVFEESIALPLEQAFFKVLNRASDGLTHVAVVDKARMTAWVDTLNALGLGHAQLIPECLTLPYEVQSATESEAVWVKHLLANGIQVVRTGAYSGFAGDAEWCAWMAFKQGVDEHSIQTLSPEALVPLSRTQLKNLGLREGAYQTTQAGSGIIKRWLPLSLAASLLALTFLGQTLWQTHQLQQEVEMLDAQTTQLFQQMFPEIKRIVNLKAQTKNALTQTTDEERLGPVALVLLVEKSLKSQPKIQVQSLTWRGSEMQLVLQADNLAALQALEQNLKQHKSFKVSLQVQSLQAALVSARLVIHV